MGSESNNVQDLNQVGFDLNFEQQHLSHVEDEEGSFLGNVQYASNVDSDNGIVSVGVTRTDDEGVSGSGVVARVRVAVGQDVAGGTELTFSVQNVQAEDPNDGTIDLAPQDLDVTVQEENQSPDANFTFDPSEPNVGETVTFDASGSSDDGSIAEYRWDFDEDGQAEETTPSATTTFSFSSAGEKAVGLTVVDDDGATGSATETVPVNAPPVVDVPLPDNTLETPGSPLTLTGLGTTVFNDPDGDDLTFSATTDAPSVVEPIGSSPEVVVLETTGTGTAQVTVTASDGTSETSTTFTATVKQREGEEPDAQAAAVLGTDATGQTFDLGDTGNKIVPSVAEGNGLVKVQRFGNAPDDATGIDEATVSQYRVVITAGGDLDFNDDTEVRFPVGDFPGINDPEDDEGAPSVAVYKRPEAGSGQFTKLPTSVDKNGTPDDTSDDEIVATTGSFSEFVLASDSEPLPVELSSFDATADRKKVRLSWTTASETNNAGFEVQRQKEQEGWTQVDYVKSKASGGTTSEAKTYEYVTVDLPVGTHRFRLKQIDLDGSSTLTDPVSVDIQMQKALSLSTPSPNPVSSSATLSFAVKGQRETTIALYNILGQQVATVYEGTPQSGERQTAQFDVGDLPSGAYFLRLRADGRTQIQRFTVVR